MTDSTAREIAKQLLREYCGDFNCASWETCTCLAIITDALHAAVAAGEAWHPIETAPKAMVLLYYPATTGRNASGEMYRVDFPGSTPFRKPTHWRPLKRPSARTAPAPREGE